MFLTDSKDSKENQIIERSVDTTKMEWNGEDDKIVCKYKQFILHQCVCYSLILITRTKK